MIDYVYTCMYTYLTFACMRSACACRYMTKVLNSRVSIYIYIYIYIHMILYRLLPESSQSGGLRLMHSCGLKQGVNNQAGSGIQPGWTNVYDLFPGILNRPQTEPWFHL